MIVVGLWSVDKLQCRWDWRLFLGMPWASSSEKTLCGVVVGSPGLQNR